MSANTSYKKRGRPPKTELKQKTIIFEQPKETEELVLHLPLTDKQTDFNTFDDAMKYIVDTYGEVEKLAVY